MKRIMMMFLVSLLVSGLMTAGVLPEVRRPWWGCAFPRAGTDRAGTNRARSAWNRRPENTFPDRFAEALGYGDITPRCATCQEGLRPDYRPCRGLPDHCTGSGRTGRREMVTPKNHQDVTPA
jgi:hypothetical protein